MKNNSSQLVLLLTCTVKGNIACHKVIAIFNKAITCFPTAILKKKKNITLNGIL